MRAALLAVVCLACSTKDNHVELSFGDLSTGTPIGFRCRDANGRLLDTRAIDVADRVMKVSIVTDFILLHGFPDCRGDDVLTYCEENPCNSIPAARSCIELSVPYGTTSDPLTSMNLILAQLTGHQVSSDAPTDAVIVRVVATAEPCASLGPALDTTMVTGCAFSCPLVLNDVSGEVLLDLPTITDMCEDGVIACAGGVLR